MYQHPVYTYAPPPPSPRDIINVKNSTEIKTDKKTENEITKELADNGNNKKVMYVNIDVHDGIIEGNLVTEKKK